MSIFGGSGGLGGVALAVLIVLNVRNGLGLNDVDGSTQIGVIGGILILSVLLQNALDRVRSSTRWHRTPPVAEPVPAVEPAQPALTNGGTEWKSSGGDGWRCSLPWCWSLRPALTTATTVDSEVGASDDTASDEEGAEPAADGSIQPGEDFESILLPKCTGIAVFDQANEGAIEAAGELEASEPEFVAPAT